MMFHPANPRFKEALQWGVGLAAMKGGGTSTQTVEKNPDPWSGAQPYMLDIMDRAQTAYNSTSKDPYSGDLWAGPNDLQKQGAEGVMQVAQGAPGGQQAQQLASSLGQNLTALPGLAAQQKGNYGSAQGANDAIATIMGSDAFSGQGVSNQISAAAQPAIQQFQEQVLPRLQSQAVMSGAYGGSRDNLTKGQAAGDVQDEIARLASESYLNRLNMGAGIGADQYSQQQNRSMEDWLQGQNNMIEAVRSQGAFAGMVPQLQQTGTQMDMMPSQAQAAYGDLLNQWEQGQIAENLQQWNNQQNAPWQGLDRYQNILGGNTAWGSNSTSTGPSGQPSTAASAIQGGIGGAGMAAGIGSMMGSGSTMGAAIGGPWGLAGGALLGALAGGLL